LNGKIFPTIVCLTLVSAACAFAQTDGGQPAKPGDEPMALRLDDTSTTTATKTESTGSGFWFFSDVAPLTGSIVTDRPGFSDSASLVQRGHFQIESGYTFSYDREGHRRVYDNTMPEIALRTGLTDWLEFRTMWNGYSYSEVLDKITTPAGRHISHTDHDDGGTDLNIGFKIALFKQHDWIPNLSIMPALNVPTGSDSKSANNVCPEVKLPWNYAITKEFTMYGSVLGRVQDGDNGQFFQTAATLAGGYKICDRTSLYLEYLGVFPAQRNEDCTHLLSVGPVFQITDNISLDMRVAAGLNEQAPDFQASIGFGIRF
jgi:hypothetical protein